jgi:metal-responsive CopG/Arc/MetJ family transcriptional regulator
MVSLPEELLQQIDEEARRRSMSRSALLAVAARRELSRPEPTAVAGGNRPIGATVPYRWHV